jgi:hypothetical protein
VVPNLPRSRRTRWSTNTRPSKASQESQSPACGFEQLTKCVSESRPNPKLYEQADHGQRDAKAGLPVDIHVGTVSISFPNVMTVVVVFFLINTGTRWIISLVRQKLLNGAPIEAGQKTL